MLIFHQQPYSEFTVADLGGNPAMPLKTKNSYHSQKTRFCTPGNRNAVCRLQNSKRHQIACMVAGAGAYGRRYKAIRKNPTVFGARSVTSKHILLIRQCRFVAYISAVYSCTDYRPYKAPICCYWTVTIATTCVSHDCTL